MRVQRGKERTTFLIKWEEILNKKIGEHSLYEFMACAIARHFDLEGVLFIEIEGNRVKVADENRQINLPISRVLMLSAKYPLISYVWYVIQKRLNVNIDEMEFVGDEIIVTVIHAPIKYYKSILIRKEPIDGGVCEIQNSAN